MHMHRAADLVTDEPIWLKKAPGYFSLVAAGHDGHLSLIQPQTQLCALFGLLGKV